MYAEQDLQIYFSEKILKSIELVCWKLSINGLLP